MFEDNKVKYANLSFLVKFTEQLNTAKVQVSDRNERLNLFGRLKARILRGKQETQVELNSNFFDKKLFEL